MSKQTEKQATTTDVVNARALLMIPLIITIVCAFFDIIFQWRLGILTEVANGADTAEIVENVQWFEILCKILGILISYFFPAFLSAAITFFWQYYFSNTWSGVRYGKGILLGSLTLLYFVLYIVYLLFSNTFYIIIFAIISGVYVALILNKCIDAKIFQADTSPGTKVVNTP